MYLRRPRSPVFSDVYTHNGCLYVLDVYLIIVMTIKQHPTCISCLDARISPRFPLFFPAYDSGGILPVSGSFLLLNPSHSISACTSHPLLLLSTPSGVNSSGRNTYTALLRIVPQFYRSTFRTFPVSFFQTFYRLSIFLQAFIQLFCPSINELFFHTL